MIHAFVSQTCHIRSKLYQWAKSFLWSRLFDLNSNNLRLIYSDFGFSGICNNSSSITPQPDSQSAGFPNKFLEEPCFSFSSSSRVQTSYTLSLMVKVKAFSIRLQTDARAIFLSWLWGVLIGMYSTRKIPAMLLMNTIKQHKWNHTNEADLEWVQMKHT